MNKLFKITFFFCLVINFSNIVLGNENFFDEGLKLYNEKNMKKLDLCLKEVLFLIQKIQTHIYI